MRLLTEWGFEYYLLETFRGKQNYINQKYIYSKIDYILVSENNSNYFFFLKSYYTIAYVAHYNNLLYVTSFVISIVKETMFVSLT